MRVSESSIINDFLRTSSRSRERIARLNLQLGTQQRINKISDDPAGAAQVMRYNSLLTRIEHYGQTITHVRSGLQMAGSALGSVGDLLQDAKAIVQGAGAEPGIMRALAAQIEQMARTALDLAGTRFGDTYLFSGSETRTPPFTLAGTPPTSTYNGNVQPLSYQVGDGMMQTVGLNGLEAFGSTAELDLSGDLDPSAAVGTTTVISINVQDGLGGSHTVELTAGKDRGGYLVAHHRPPRRDDRCDAARWIGDHPVRPGHGCAPEPGGGRGVGPDATDCLAVGGDGSPGCDQSPRGHPDPDRGGPFGPRRVEPSCERL